VQRSVGAPGGLFIGSGAPQHAHHGVHAVNSGRGDYGVPQVHVQCRGLADQERPQPGRGFDEPGLPVSLVGGRTPGLSQEQVNHLVEQVVLVAYVAVERHRRDAEFGGQAADRHLLVAAGPDDRDRGLDDVVA
jgi:hypothetical protein